MSRETRVRPYDIQVKPVAEWPATLNVSALLDAGWQPTPFREFVLKIHSRCNLACDYCYMYEMVDQSWRSQPKRMSTTIANRTATRIGEHARRHGLNEIRLVLHGGEPLLAGAGLITHVLAAVGEATGEHVTVEASVQTNGVGLDEQFLALFSRLGVRVGISLDGDAGAQNRHRRFANGRGSHAAVTSGLRRLTSDRYRHLLSGLLCVIDLHNDPLDTYSAMLEFAPPRVDFLLPHGTWDSPPPSRAAEEKQTPYADWLIAIFDRWYDQPRTQVRLFSEIIRLQLGQTASTESVGLAPADFLVIETDGAIAQVDSLKATFHGAPQTGLHVDWHKFDDALLLPEIAARQVGFQALSQTCQQCRIWRVCGGGQYAHRYRRGTGFANPSVYCPDLMRLIDHIGERVAADIGQRKRQRQYVMERGTI
jgi:uncharacterized protein